MRDEVSLASSGALAAQLNCWTMRKIITAVCTLFITSVAGGFDLERSVIPAENAIPMLSGRWISR